MGLDVVELVMRVEEEFGLSIEDEAAEQLQTVGQLHTFILSRLDWLDASRCLSSATFYQLRRGLVDLAVAPRRAIAPATPTESLLPIANRRQLWESWSRNAGVELPALQKSKWMRAAWWLALLATLGVGPILWPAATFVVFSYYVLAFSLCFVALKWSERYAIHLPAGCALVGDVTKTVMRLNYGIGVQSGQRRSVDEVWEKLKMMLVDDFDVAPEAIVPDAQFVRDFGFG